MEQARIISATYVLSCAAIKDLPAETLPEVGFIGRSNVGKSSLINALCNQKNLARVSKTPGRTQTLNFFEVIFRKGKDPSNDVQAYFVDFPGFGYAKVNNDIRAEWTEFLTTYLLQRNNLKTIVLLLDARRDLQAEELWVLEHFPGNIILCLTKCDKLSRGEMTSKQKEITSRFEIDTLKICFTSSDSKVGMAELLQMIVDSLRE